MARKVYIYSDINSLDKLSFFDEIRNYPHIVATSSMSKGLKKRYEHQIESIIDVHSIQKEFCQDWVSTSTIFEQYINISSLLRGMVNLPSTLRPLGEAFFKNKKDVFNSIRSLVEAGIFPNDLMPKNDEEKLFKLIWERVEASDKSFGKFRSEMFMYEHNEESFASVLKCFPQLEDATTIVMNGFYYITPIQERIFDILESHGKQLIFMGCINLSQKAVNQIWLDNFNVHNKFDSVDSWVSDLECENKNLFGNVFNGVDGLKTINNVTIQKYKNEAAFIKDVKRLDKNGFKIYSMDSKMTESMLKEIFPDKFKNRHLLSYPVGQYFYTLHSLWDAKKTALSIDAEGIHRCLSSGWVTVDGKNGKNYTHQFEMLAPFFENCRDFDSWRDRMAVFRELSTTLEEVFEKHIKDMPLSSQNRHKIMSNPFLNFSFMAVDKNDVETVFDIIVSIFKTAEDLFGDGSEIDISMHFKKIAQIIKDGYDESSLYKEEIEIIKDIRQRVENTQFTVKLCMPEDISEAMMLIIGGGILNDDDFETQAVDDEDYVQSMYQIETAPLLSEGKIHLCFADEVHLPGCRKRYTWPLNHDMLEQIAEGISDRRLQYIRDFLFVNEMAPVANRYLFNSAICNKDVELSWIEEENGKKIAESPYIRMLTSVFDCKINEKSNDIKDLNVSEIQVKKIPAYKFDEMNAILEEKLDLYQCPWKYAYGYITSKFPSYKSSFHFSFVLSSIIGAFAMSSGLSREEVSKNVLSCFAYLRGIEKRNIKDFVPGMFDKSEDNYDDVSYTRLRLIPHFANRNIAKKTINEYMESREIGSSEEEYKLFFGSNPNDDYCMYCQYKDECIHAALVEE